MTANNEIKILFCAHPDHNSCCEYGRDGEGGDVEWLTIEEAKAKVLELYPPENGWVDHKLTYTYGRSDCWIKWWKNPVEDSHFKRGVLDPNGVTLDDVNIKPPGGHPGLRCEWWVDLKPDTWMATASELEDEDEAPDPNKAPEVVWDV